MRRDQLEHVLRAASRIGAEPDLVVSKLVAGREKDFRFTEALLREGLIDVTTLLTRIDEVAIDEAEKEHLRTWVRATATQGTAT